MNRFISLVLIYSFISFPGVAKNKHHHSLSLSCNVEMEDIYFGNYNPFEEIVRRNYGYLKVRCSGTGSAHFSIKLSGGNSNNPLNRYLYSPSNRAKLFYNIYYNNCVWGNGTGGTCVINSSISSSEAGFSEKVFTIVGVIPPIQNVPAGNDYQDVLTVVIEY